METRDVVVHNGRTSVSQMDRFLDTPLELIERQLAGNLMAPLALNQALLPAMLAQGGGTIVNITSASAYSDPMSPAGQGGWGMGYGVSKGASQRVAAFLHVELGSQGIRAYNVSRASCEGSHRRRIRSSAAPTPARRGRGGPVVEWLATSP